MALNRYKYSQNTLKIEANQWVKMILHREYLSVVAGFISIIGGLPYVTSILRGPTKPEKASWLIWSILDSIILAGMYNKNTLNGQIIIGSINAWIIAILALKYGSPGWKKRDKFCLTGALIAIIVWKIFNSPVLGIVVSLIVMLLGSWPTFVATWNNPSKENKFSWTMFWISSVCVLISIKQPGLASTAQPITFFIINFGIASILYFRKSASP